MFLENENRNIILYKFKTRIYFCEKMLNNIHFFMKITFYIFVDFYIKDRRV